MIFYMYTAHFHVIVRLAGIVVFMAYLVDKLSSHLWLLGCLNSEIRASYKSTHFLLFLLQFSSGQFHLRFPSFCVALKLKLCHGVYILQMDSCIFVDSLSTLRERALVLVCMFLYLKGDHKSYCSWGQLLTETNMHRNIFSPTFMALEREKRDGIC